MCRELKRCLPSHNPRHIWNGSAVFRDEHAGDPIIGTHAVYILLDNIDAGRLSGLDRCVQFINRRLFETKSLILHAECPCHDVAPLISSK